MLSSYSIRPLPKLPTTGADWQLYTYTMKCGRAARALTAALKKAAKACTPNAQGGRKMSAEAALEKYMYPVMSKYSSFGAYDSEPSYVARNYLERISGERNY